MYKYSEASTKRVQSCEVNLQRVFESVLKVQDHSILCGHRDAVAQNAAYASGASTLQYANSKHNVYPSMAVDVAPYPIDWDDLQRFYDFAYLVLQQAEILGINIRWGGDWDGDGDFADQNFNDLVHYELVT